MNAHPAVDVAVVMLTFNQRETTLRALASLMPQVGPTDRVIVWDNGSVDGTVGAVEATYPQVLARRHSDNLGVAGGRNAGARLAIERFAPKHLLFLDNDLVLCPGYVEAMREMLDADPSVGQVQSKLLYLHEPERINDGGGCRINFVLGRTLPVGYREIDKGQYDRPVPCISCGGSMMVRATLFRELGGFDPAFNPFGPEDLDFSLRLQRRGFKAMYNPKAVALHEVGSTFARSSTEAAKYAQARMEIWLRFLRRYGTRWQCAGFLAIGAPLLALRLASREVLRGRPIQAFAALRGMFAALITAGREA
jgi:GT2 family glycosyltransferase